MDNKLRNRNICVFGYGLAVLSFVVGIRMMFKHAETAYTVLWFGLSMIFAVLTFRKRAWIEAFYDKWMFVAHKIGTVITVVVLTVVYALFFGIAGIILKILKKDLLDRKVNPAQTSYWHKRTQEPFEKSRYLQQF